MSRHGDRRRGRQKTQKAAAPFLNWVSEPHSKASRVKGQELGWKTVIFLTCFGAGNVATSTSAAGAEAWLLPGISHFLVLGFGIRRQAFAQPELQCGYDVQSLGRLRVGSLHLPRSCARRSEEAVAPQIAMVWASGLPSRMATCSSGFPPRESGWPPLERLLPFHLLQSCSFQPWKAIFFIV